MSQRFRLLGRCSALVGTTVLSTAAFAGTAGLDLQGPVPPQPPADPLPSSAAPAAPPAAAVGESVELQSIVIEGNQAVPASVLLARLGPVAGRRFTMAELEALARAVADAYKALGYPFVRAWLPPQRIEGGVLHVQVLEGVIGHASATGSDAKSAGAQPFLDAGIPRGEVIRDSTLERTMLLLNDQPGFRVHPVLRPGGARGESDLLVSVERKSRVSGEVGVDNTGNLSTGEYRGRAALTVDSPFRFGDRISLAAMTTNRHLWLGSADYETPLGATGWRGQAGVMRTSYQLGGAFSALGASGTATTASVRASYSLLRSQASNVLLGGSLQHKALQDRFFDGELLRTKASRSAVAFMQFDHRDAWLGGGVTYGQAGVTAGVLQLDAASQALDQLTAQTGGHFDKWTFDVARIQKLPGVWSAYARLSGQGTAANLDASEKFGLGGFLGVRAYPMGEGTGDRGWLSQLELRREMAPGATVFALADAGRVTANARPWDTSSDARRAISGAGFGARWLHGRWSMESTLAWRTHGGAPQAEARDRNPRLFLTGSYSFSR